VIRLVLGIALGVALMTTFPNQTVQLSELTKGLINSGAIAIAEQTKEKNLVDKVLN
jgi:hypothetical protein|tara:strand:- start:708 stop:875 length:168 start_codon:yes stop_codon:yes gene_type:complete